MIKLAGNAHCTKPWNGRQNAGFDGVNSERDRAREAV